MKSIGAIEIAPTYSFNNINVFLDEIELYFHPEYQRVFISDLLKQLSDISFRNIKNINFLFYYTFTFYSFRSSATEYIIFK